MTILWLLQTLALVVAALGGTAGIASFLKVSRRTASCTPGLPRWT